jgi:hypothetical protein
MIGIIVVGLGIAAALYMLRPRDPIIKVVQVHIKGFSVRTQVMPIPAVLVDLEVSMDVLCKNKNPVPISCSEVNADNLFSSFCVCSALLYAQMLDSFATEHVRFPYSSTCKLLCLIPLR